MKKIMNQPDFQIVGPEWSALPGVFALTVCAEDQSGERVDFGTNEMKDAPDRARLEALIVPQTPIHWLTQVHGDCTILIPEEEDVREADAVITRTPGTVCAIRTADCVPILIATKDGRAVGAIHAGWRGLGKGVIEAALKRFEAPLEDIVVWLGPAIGQVNYEVGEDVYSAFSDYRGEDAFIENVSSEGETKYLLDCYQVAQNILLKIGIAPENISGGEFDTYEDTRFHSARRDGAASGRMATVIWFE